MLAALIIVISFFVLPRFGTIGSLILLIGCTTYAFIRVGGV